MPIELWFPTPVYFIDASLNVKQTIEKEYLQKEQTISKQLTTNAWGDSITTSYSEEANLIEEHSLSALKTHIIAATSEFVSSLSTKKTELTISSSWVNYFKPGQFEERHQHYPHFISGVYYLRTNGHDGDLHFYAPSTAMFAINDDTTPLTFKIAKYPPKEGRIILFPSWVEHSVGMNKTQDTRVSIAFNISKTL
jgi:uncharacterized protein (TIGR02466 family)